MTQKEATEEAANVCAVNVSRFPLFGCAALCLLIVAGCYHDTGEGEMEATKEAERSAAYVRDHPMPKVQKHDAALTKWYDAEVAAGQKELEPFYEAKRQKMFAEFVCADRRAANLLLQATQRGRQQPGQSGQWAHDRYRNPLFKKYHITEKGRFALDAEGGDKNWTFPDCDPAP